LVDDNQATLDILTDVVNDLSHEAVACSSGEEALMRSREQSFPLIITDIKMPGMDGLTLLQKLKESPETAQSDVIIVTGHGDLNTAVDALRKGAYDFLPKPINAREFAAAVERSAEHQALLRENRELTDRFEQHVTRATQVIRKELDEARSVLREVSGIGEIVTVSPAMKKIVEETRIYHEDPSVPVLIEGETGVGKEIVARLIHYGLAEISAPFVDINCTAISTELFESELFGYEPGSFTGGRADGSPGKLEAAGDGTLFLDEVGDMPLHLQPKLLRVLQTRSYYRVGGMKKRDFKARIICATNQSLRTMMNEGRFRQDLYHRLKVGHVRIPPLRERVDEIPALADFFLRREAKKKRKKFRRLSPAVIEKLCSLNWPGNVRELENTIERAVLTADGETLDLQHLAFMRSDTTVLSAFRKPGTTLDPDSIELPDTPLDLEKLNREIIRKALEKFDGNKTQAAQYLGMSRGAFRNRVKE
jgi:DNA-binding NtrC family response regulator